MLESEWRGDHGAGSDMMKEDHDRQYLLLPGMSWVGEWIVKSEWHDDLNNEDYMVKDDDQ